VTAGNVASMPEATIRLTIKRYSITYEMDLPLVRGIALVGKVLGIRHHLHDIDSASRANLSARSFRIGTGGHHAEHGEHRRDRGRHQMTVIWRILSSADALSVDPARHGNALEGRELGKRNP
jgi:hypothetical protein